MKAFLMSLIVTSLLILSLPKTEAHYQAPISPPTTQELIKQYSTQYGVSSVTMGKIIACESNYKPNAIGDGDKSFGLAQIHLPSHPNVTKAQALDPEFSIDFLAKNLAKKKGKMWTCWRKYNT